MRFEEHFYGLYKLFSIKKIVPFYSKPYSSLQGSLVICAEKITIFWNHKSQHLNLWKYNIFSPKLVQYCYA